MLSFPRACFSPPVSPHLQTPLCSFSPDYVAHGLLEEHPAQGVLGEPLNGVIVSRVNPHQHHCGELPASSQDTLPLSSLHTAARKPLFKIESPSCPLLKAPLIPRLKAEAGEAQPYSLSLCSADRSHFQLLSFKFSSSCPWPQETLSILAALDKGGFPFGSTLPRLFQSPSPPLLCASQAFLGEVF